MRTLGPGSIASLLKIALDVAYFLVFAVLVLEVLLLLAGFLAVPFSSGLPAPLADLARRWPAALGGLASVGVYLAVLLAIFFRLRQVFATLTSGDPFRPENVQRLRAVGLALIALEAAGYGVRVFAAALIPDVGPARGGVSLSAWFAILVVFVLAEVFREGARLRRDAELTI